MRSHQVRSYGPTVTADDSTSHASSSPPSDGHDGIHQYEIRVKGHLGSRWAAWFDGLRLTSEDDGITVIRGPVTDQAALHGVLQQLRDLAIPLVSVTQLTPDAPTERPAR